MLARAESTLPVGDYAFEVTWDGFRTVASTEGGFRVRSRRGWRMEPLIPELPLHGGVSCWSRSSLAVGSGSFAELRRTEGFLLRNPMPMRWRLLAYLGILVVFCLALFGTWACTAPAATIQPILHIHMTVKRVLDRVATITTVRVAWVERRLPQAVVPHAYSFTGLTFQNALKGTSSAPGKGAIPTMRKRRRSPSGTRLPSTSSARWSRTRRVRLSPLSRG
jgi:hypothetical protein